MIKIDLLETVQPKGGWFAVVGIKGKSTVQKLVATREEVNQLAQKFVGQQREVYFGVAKFKTDENRKKPNVKGLKAFWMDIDCGESKVLVNEKTGRPDGYVDQSAGFTALKDFCALIGIPKPLLVNSGRGIHAYWPLTAEVTREAWEPVAHRLQELCLLHKFYVDPHVFEVSRVLRIPGTFNFKDTPPSPVEVVYEGELVDFEEFKTILGVKEQPVVKESAPKRELSELAKSMMDNRVTKFGKIMVRTAQGSGCNQLMHCYDNQDSISEPLWWSAISIANFCVDRDTAIHKLSEKHPGYDAAVTESKASHSVGPHTCNEFEKSNPGGCDGCPHKGKIKSPIVLGRDIEEATAEDNIVTTEPEEEGEAGVVHHIPKFPHPFFRGKNGGVYMSPAEEEAEPVLVYEHDIYVVKCMRDPHAGWISIIKLHLPREGVVEFAVANTAIADKTELRKVLASHGVVSTLKQSTNLATFIQFSIKELQIKRKAEQMRTQFGWADKYSKFIIGDREITRDGTFHSPPSASIASVAEDLTPAGTLEKWKEVFALYGRPGLEAHAFGALTAFGAPLLGFLGQSGAIINLIHPTSGTGKSTILYMCNSVWGHPKKLCATWEDTSNAKIMRLGMMNNLPFTVDEMTNTSPKDFSALAYGMSQGRGKDRVKSSSNELRPNLTTWQTISLCSSNASFYEKLSAMKASPDGEMMRLMEYKIDATNIIPPALAKDMFDHQLLENYGHAGEIYAKWLVDNREEAMELCLNIQKKLDMELGLTNRERFWSSSTASNIAGGLIAKGLSLIDWDMKAIYKHAAKEILVMRKDVAPPISDVMAIIGDYVNRHTFNTLVVNDGADRRSSMPALPMQEPKGELLIRYEPDTKKMFIVSKRFKDHCVEFQTNYKDTLEKLGEKNIFLGGGNKRMAKGMKMVSPAVHALEFDCSNEEFINVEALLASAELENTDGGGGS